MEGAKVEIAMKHFIFRLQKYLNLKKQQEDIQRLILSNAQAAYEEEKRKLALIDRKIEALLEYNKTLRQMRLNIEILLLADTYHCSVQQKEIQAVSVEDALVRLTCGKREVPGSAKGSGSCWSASGKSCGKSFTRTT